MADVIEMIMYLLYKRGIISKIEFNNFQDNKYLGDDNISNFAVIIESIADNPL